MEITTAVRQFEENLGNLINDSHLPAVIVRLVLESTLRNVKNWEDIQMSEEVNRANTEEKEAAND